MKIKKALLLLVTICVIMILNINVTQNGITKLKICIGTLKDAQADQKPPNSWNTWYLGCADPWTDWFGWTNCWERYGCFKDAVYCSSWP
jgi:hypothetical protein